MTRALAEFKPTRDDWVGLYTCGPTVYDYAHLGNLRTYIFEDWLKRILKYNGYQVRQVMNITDVGHLTDDADDGEDKLEIGARREGKTAGQIADFYTAAFKNDLAALNISQPDIWCRATDHIPEQIALARILEQKGYTYRASDGLYFDTFKLTDYNKLSHLPLADLQAGARVKVNPEKKHPTDFAVWKFSPPDSQRQMEWPSPWGVGFPGWHLECSAMSLRYLSGHLDIHCGGIDHINVHHTNEIAQSEAATGQPFFHYWLHGAFLNIAGGKKMAKSADNFLTLDKALTQRDLPPLVFRYACAQTHYRKPMEYGPDIMANAANGYAHLRNQVARLGTDAGLAPQNWQTEFLSALNDDLNLPAALAVLSGVLKSDLPLADQKALILKFDQVLGLDLTDSQILPAALPLAAAELFQARQRARAVGDWATADKQRAELLKLGFVLEDGPDGTIIRPAK